MAHEQDPDVRLRQLIEGGDHPMGPAMPEDWDLEDVLKHLATRGILAPFDPLVGEEGGESWTDYGVSGAMSLFGGPVMRRASKIVGPTVSKAAGSAGQKVGTQLRKLKDYWTGGSEPDKPIDVAKRTLEQSKVLRRTPTGEIPDVVTEKMDRRNFMSLLSPHSSAQSIYDWMTKGDPDVTPPKGKEFKTTDIDPSRSTRWEVTEDDGTVTFERTAVEDELRRKTFDATGATVPESGGRPLGSFGDDYIEGEKEVPVTVQRRSPIGKVLGKAEDTVTDTLETMQDEVEEQETQRQEEQIQDLINTGQTDQTQGYVEGELDDEDLDDPEDPEERYQRAQEIVESDEPIVGDPFEQEEGMSTYGDTQQGYARQEEMENTIREVSEPVVEAVSKAADVRRHASPNPLMQTGKTLAREVLIVQEAELIQALEAEGLPAAKIKERIEQYREAKKILAGDPGAIQRGADAIGRFFKRY